MNEKDKIYDTSTNAGAFYCIFCDNITVKDLTLTKNDTGIFFWKTDNSRVENVTAMDNHKYGIHLCDSSGNVLTNNTFLNNSSSGIYLGYSNDNILSNNIISDSNSGISIQSSNSNILDNNNTTNSGRYGISLHGSCSNNTLSDNTVSTSNLYGIFLSRSGNNTLTGNEMSNNQYNFGITGSDFDFDNNIDTTNTAEGKPIYYLVNVRDKIYDASTNAGTFYCISCDNVTVKDLTLTKNDYGIFFWKTTNSKIENVTALDNRYHGIALYYSDNNIVNNNTLNRLTISGVLQAGIFLYSSNNNILNGNTALNNFYGISLWSSSSNILNNNKATSNDQYGIFLWQSSNNNLIYNTVSKNWSGIHLLLSSSNKLSNNSASDNSSGIYLKSYSNGNSLDNNIVNNNAYGIQLWGSWIHRVNNNILTNNTISSNNIGGLNLTGSDNNKVYHNNFIGNKFYQANIPSGSLDNLFDDGYPSGGNYWSDYTGVDLKKGENQDEYGIDGIGDTAYTFYYGGIDNYPFMEENGWQEEIEEEPIPDEILNKENEFYESAKTNIEKIDTKYVEMTNHAIKSLAVGAFGITRDNSRQFQKHRLFLTPFQPAWRRCA